MPTFASIAGAKVPTDRKIDGANIMPHLTGESVSKPAHDTFFYYKGMKLQAVRKGDWKLVIDQDKPANQKKLAKPFTPILFNLKTDIGESNDVADKHPEIVIEIKALVAGMKEDLGLDGPAPGSRELGRVANPKPLIEFDK